MSNFDQRNQQVETQYNADRITIHQPPLSLTEKERKQNRTRMLDRVQRIWIEGVLEPSLQETHPIPLELQNKPSAVITPCWQVMREFDKTGLLRSATSSIAQVYDQANGEVLILGEPGAGKTTLLLELTRDLLKRAHQDESHPMPVVFSLSSWATKRQHLTEWLAAELHMEYQIPLGLATSWIEANKVLPLLDGLDEVAAPHQEACIKAINTYRQEHGLLPMVVSCRQAGYLTLTTRLQLCTAVAVQSLTATQIDTYLMSCGKDLKALRETLRKDVDLRSLASTPLMLNVLVAVYQGVQSEEITPAGSLNMKQDQIFATYVQRMLAHHTRHTRYTSQQTIHWLSSLARRMKQQSQTIFYLEQMQHDWLSSTSLLQAYEWGAMRLPNLLIGSLICLLFTVLILPYATNIISPFSIPIFLGGLLGWLLSAGNITQQPARNNKKARSILWQRLFGSILMALGIGLSMGLSNWSYGWPHGLSAGLSSSLLQIGSYGWPYGLSAGLASILLQMLLVKSSTMQLPYQTLLPVWRMKLQRLTRNPALRNGLIVGLVDGLGVGLSNIPVWGAVLHLGLSNGLLYGLSAWLLSLLLVRHSMEVQVTDRLTWSWINLGRSLRSSSHIRASLQVATLVGLSLAVYVTGFHWSDGSSITLNDGLIAGMGNGLIIGLSYWLLIGLFQGVSSETIEDQQRIAPNQGIRRSAYNGLVLGCISAICVYFFTYLSTLLTGYLLLRSLPPRSIIDLLITGLSAGLLAGLLKGGLVSLRHTILRLLLWRTDITPLNYSQFLDDAAEHLLLRKVGGGYTFMHRLLLDYFASLEDSPDADAPTMGKRHASDTMISSRREPLQVDENLDTTRARPSSLPEASPLLPCGHKQYTTNARFCRVCGLPISIVIN
jgi:NACHT domain